MWALDLAEPYGFEFFRNGVLVAVVAGALSGLLGVFVVLRGMSYIGHGLSHAVFGGAAASAVMGFNYFIGAGIWGIVSGVLISLVYTSAASDELTTLVRGTWTSVTMTTPRI